MSSSNSEKNAGYGWLLFCSIGMISSLTLYGVVLEYSTSGGRKLHEISFIFVTTTIYSITAYVARGIFGEKPANDISKKKMLMISLMSIASAYTSVRSLRYVIYPVQVLFKSCKPVPVMLFGVLFGQKYTIRKYVNVIIITTGVALFMVGGTSTAKTNSGDKIDTTLMGALILFISLCFDGATGALEDKMMSGENSIGPYDLMFNIQLGKSVISFCALIVANGVSDFVKTINEGGVNLIVLGITGAIGQVFLFLTISKFGALNCALLGLLRKMLSLVLSFMLYGHTLNAPQTVGLVLSVTAMSANFMGKSEGHGHGHGHGGGGSHNTVMSQQHPNNNTTTTSTGIRQKRKGSYNDKDVETEIEEEEQEDEETPFLLNQAPNSSNNNTNGNTHPNTGKSPKGGMYLSNATSPLFMNTTEFDKYDISPHNVRHHTHQLPIEQSQNRVDFTATTTTTTTISGNTISSNETKSSSINNQGNYI